MVSDLEREYMETVARSYAQEKEQFLLSNLPKALPDNVWEVVSEAIEKGDRDVIKQQIENYDLFIGEDVPSDAGPTVIRLCKGKVENGEDVYESDNVEIIAEKELNTIR